MGGIPRLFMAVAQALGSDMGIVIELESIDMLQIPSAGVKVTDKGVSAASVTSQQQQYKVIPEDESCKSKDVLIWLPPFPICFFHSLFCLIG